MNKQPEYYKTEELCPGVTRIRCASGELCFLITGSEQAVLIDTGSGYRGLAELVGGLSRVPVSVLLTHAHRDHAGGIVQFSRVYVHPAENGLMAQLAVDEFRTGYPRGLKPKVFGGIDMEEFPRLYEPEILPLHDGMEFDLGGTELEIWAAPGHTAGSVCIYDRGRRLLFAGDTVIDCALLIFEQSTDIETYMKTLELLKSRKALCDKIFCSHFDGAVPPGGIESLIGCCREVIAGRDEHIPAHMFRRDCFAAHRPAPNGVHRADGVWGNVFYK